MKDRIYRFPCRIVVRVIMTVTHRNLNIICYFSILIVRETEKDDRENGAKNANDMERSKHVIGMYNCLLLTENYHLASQRLCSSQRS